MKHLAGQLYCEWKHFDDVSPLAIEGLALSMTAILCRNLDLRDSGRRPAWMKCVQEFLEAHFREPLSLQMLADEVSVHPAHLTRQFRRHMGMTVSDFVRVLRISFARQQLSDTEKPLVEIALESGFTQQAHFTTVFRRITGTTPREYRRRFHIGKRCDAPVSSHRARR